MTKDSKPDVVIGRTLCVQCGYDLATLRKEGRCPECGKQIQETLAYLEANYDRRPLMPSWMRQCRIGCITALIGLYAAPVVALWFRSSRAIVNSEFIPRVWECALMVFIVGLALNAIGLKFRYGETWLILWIVACVLAAVLFPALGVP